MPFGSDAPGLGAPLGPPPPPSILAGAVGRGLEDEDEEGVGAAVTLPEVAFPPPPATGEGVMVTTTLVTTVDSTRPEPRVTKVVGTVARMTEGEVALELGAGEGAGEPLAGEETGTGELDGGGWGDDDWRCGKRAAFSGDEKRKSDY